MTNIEKLSNSQITWGQLCILYVAEYILFQIGLYQFLELGFTFADDYFSHFFQVSLNVVLIGNPAGGCVGPQCPISMKNMAKEQKALLAIPVLLQGTLISTPFF